MSEKWRQSEICIVINEKSQCSITKHLRNDELRYYTFIIQFANKRIFKIGEHLTKLQAKWLIFSCTLFVLHFCPQTCWSRQISWITELLLVVVHRQINEQILDLMTDRLTPSVTDLLLIVYGILLRQLFFVAAVVMEFLYGLCKQLFVSELNNAYFSRHLF